MTFKTGKLYRRLPPTFPSDRDNSDIMHIALSIDVVQLKSEELILVLEPLYIVSSKLRSTIHKETVRYQRWHLKILKNDITGYASLWEDAWIEI